MILYIDCVGGVGGRHAARRRCSMPAPTSPRCATALAATGVDGLDLELDARRAPRRSRRRTSTSSRRTSTSHRSWRDVREIVEAAGARRRAARARARRVPPARARRGADPRRAARARCTSTRSASLDAIGDIIGVCVAAGLARRRRDRLLAAADLARVRAGGARPPAAAGAGDARDPARGRRAARAARGRAPSW